MSAHTGLRARAEDLAGALPPLLADARHLAQTVMPGAHGRRRSGQGDEFWQFRHAVPGDAARSIDWRRSGRSDAQFVREKEWQASQSVLLWVDRGASMRFASAPHLPTKARRGRELALAAAILLVRAGERVGLAGEGMPPRGGETQLIRLAGALADDEAGDFGQPDTTGIPSRSQALFLSDFLGPVEPVETALAQLSARGVRGALVQVLDPEEEAFSFTGRTIFESMGASLRHETMQAAQLRDRYVARLNQRRARLATLCRASGWQFHCHHTGDPAAAALLWAYRALERAPA